MNRILAVALLLLAPNPAVADEAKLDEPISLVLLDAVAADVFRSFGVLLEVEVVVDPAIDSRLTIQLEEVSARTALQASCESLSCSWLLEDGTLTLSAVKRPPAGGGRPAALPPLSLELEDVGAAEFFHSLAQILEVDLVLDPLVVGKFSITLDEAGLDQILREVCRELGCRAGLVVTAEGRVLEVRPKTGG